MRIFIATLANETVSFSAFPVGMKSFEELWLRRRDGTLNSSYAHLAPAVEWRRLAAREGHEIIESVSAVAQTAGPVVRSVYEELRDQILDDLAKSAPVDVVLLYLHGAMAADGYDDCEGDLIERARAIVGPRVAIGAELDLHAYVTPQMTESATAIITFKEYPHTDHIPRAAELYDICTRAARGEIKPVTAVHDMRMISLWRTSQQPMRGFVDRLETLEGRDGVLSISFVHANPWLDAPNNCARMLVITDNAPEKAEALARSLAEEVWADREQSRTEYLEIGDALDHAASASEFPIVLADVADNAGGGAPSDSTFLLKPMAERQLKDVAFGCLWDPVVVQICFNAGLGARLQVRLGGKCGPTSGEPLDLEVTVMGLARSHSQSGTSSESAVSPLGDSAWIRAGGIDIVVNSIRTQTFAPNAFTGLGIDLQSKKIIVVKSTQHFYAAFSKFAKEVLYVTSDSTVRPDFAKIGYRKNLTPYWPKVENPFVSG